MAELEEALHAKQSKQQLVRADLWLGETVHTARP